VGFAALLVLAVLAAPNEELRWHAPSECPDAAAVRAMVDTRLGRALAPGVVEVDARVESIGAEGYRLELAIAMAGIRQERTLVAQDCELLARASALVIALGVDAIAVAELEHEALAQPMIPTAPSEIDAPPQRSRAPPTATGRSARTTGRGLHAVLALVGGVERGALPGTTGAIDAAVGLRGRGFRLELAGTWLGPRTADAAVGSVRAQLGAVALRGCPELALRRVSFPLCVGIELGAMRGAGDDAPHHRTVHGLWVAPTISPGMRVGGPALAFVARGEVAIPVQRPSFVLSEPGEPILVFAPAPVSARLWLGIEWRLGRRDGSTR
jgi:hypothetical protein